ncbi:MAG: class I SAM-dependent methyltransferase [Anaerolineae bacterium]|nr:class I SAM-dependent methyltransferase [Anaerolineae bacterium]
MDILDELLIDYYRHPSLAIWRAVEIRVLRKLDWPSPILDVGCGSGLFASKIGPDFKAGFDMSGIMLREARQSQTYGYLAQADAVSFPYPDNSFACVFSNCVLEHIPAIETVFAEAARVLAPGGKFIFTVPSEKFTDWLFFPWLKRKWGNAAAADAHAQWFNDYQEHCHIDSHQIWDQRLQNVNLQLEQWQYYMPFFSTLIFSFLDDVWKGPLPHQPLRNIVSIVIRKISHELPVSWVRRLWSIVLGPFYRRDVYPSKKGSGLLIVATKPVSDRDHAV